MTVTDRHFGNVDELNAKQLQDLRDILQKGTRSNRERLGYVNLHDMKRKVAYRNLSRFLVYPDGVRYCAGQHYPAEIAEVRKQLLY